MLIPVSRFTRVSTNRLTVPRRRSTRYGCKFKPSRASAPPVKQTDENRDYALGSAVDQLSTNEPYAGARVTFAHPGEPSVAAWRMPPAAPWESTRSVAGVPPGPRRTPGEIGQSRTAEYGTSNLRGNDLDWTYTHATDGGDIPALGGTPPFQQDSTPFWALHMHTTPHRDHATADQELDGLSYVYV